MLTIRKKTAMSGTKEGAIKAREKQSAYKKAYLILKREQYFSREEEMTIDLNSLKHQYSSLVEKNSLHLALKQINAERPFNFEKVCEQVLLLFGFTQGYLKTFAFYEDLRVVFLTLMKELLLGIPPTKEEAQKRLEIQLIARYIDNKVTPVGNYLLGRFCYMFRKTYEKSYTPSMTKDTNNIARTFEHFGLELIDEYFTWLEEGKMKDWPQGFTSTNYLASNTAWTEFSNYRAVTKKDAAKAGSEQGYLKYFNVLSMPREMLSFLSSLEHINGESCWPGALKTLEDLRWAVAAWKTYNEQDRREETNLSKIIAKALELNMINREHAKI
jgi:hypothetical protein